MLRIVWVCVAVVLLLSLFFTAVSYRIAASAPLLPQNPLFPAQVFSEQVWGLGFNRDELNRADILLTLFARRTEDLAAEQGTDHEIAAMVYLDQAFDRAVRAIGEVPGDDHASLRVSLALIAGRAVAVMDTLDATQHGTPETTVLMLRAKLESVLRIANDPDSTAADIASLAAIKTRFSSNFRSTPDLFAMSMGDSDLERPRIVPFLAAARGAVAHGSFPLFGGHANTGCDSCHNQGDYRGTSRTCISCHSLNDVHSGEYGINCGKCHSIYGWNHTRFDHSNIDDTDCSQCHLAPSGHRAGACRQCHNDTDDFRNAAFDHGTAAGSDCGECHLAPPDHYAGTCRACHIDTAVFINAVFNHATIGASDCVVCHAPPLDHYAGACRDCHTDRSNFVNAIFNHAIIGASDCGDCHPAPAAHYAGTCRVCHTDTSSFANAVFIHGTIGEADCIGCHKPPPGHYAGTCRACHTDTSSFGNATFDHSFIGDSDCVACHDPPPGHYAGTCRACHTDTSSFANATFDHSFIGDSDCVACH
ncbi:MAG: hypothetical protein ACE5E7_01565, partial [Anaerolineae bacterium]